ncbi:hypothetical protein ACSSP6_005145 [Escherichia coli]
MKKPTLKQLIEAAEKTVKPDDWYRQNLILEKFHGMSKTTLVEYCKEMETIPEFAEGVVKPGHSMTFIHVYTFIWFLRWKDANKYRVKKISPTEILKEAS